MDQLKTVKSLTSEEMKNVYLAVACGCLNTIHNETPGPIHKKKKRVARQLSQEILRYAGSRLPKVKDRNKALFQNIIETSGKVMDEILEESGQQSTHILLNLAGFCLEHLPLNQWHLQKYNALFDLWQEAYRFEDTYSGERIFARINTELQILTAQRGGAIF